MTGTHKKAKWAGIIVLGLLLIFIVFVSLFDWNALRPMVARRITAATGRPTSIDGDLKVHLWSWNPSAEVNGLKLENPKWADRDLMFGAQRITVSVSLGWLLRGQIVVPQITLVAPTINLERDSKGRASWELGTQEGRPNGNTQPAKLPTVRRVIIQDGKLHVVDQIRKLTFSGSLVAAEQAGKDDPAALKIRCSGSLNAKPFRLEANGGPLLALEPHTPYSFSAHITASDINLESRVTIPKPFDLSDLQIKFVLTGDDLADGFYLTGLALPNTPKYRLAATVKIAGTRFIVDDLKGTVGSSDLSGNGQVETATGKPKLTAALSSVNLKIADLAPALGQPPPKPTSLSNAAAGAQPRTAKAKPKKAPGSADIDTKTASYAHPGDRLLPDADLQVDRVRGMDADVTYKAQTVNAAKVPMKELSFHLVLDNGLLTLDPLAFTLDQGKFAGKVQIDARKDVPTSAIDMHIQDIDLSQFKSATMKQAPLQGIMSGRFELRGTGGSIHKFASTSNGAVSVVIPHGQISDVLAELTGINVLRGLGLLLSGKQGQTEIRCGIVDFRDQQGKLNTSTVFVDTTQVVVTGRGSIDLNSENIDLALQGDPKKLRLLRVRSPITLHGTMLHPAVGVKADKLVAQGAVAVALGALLTPVGAALAFIDPGLAKDKDCSNLLAQASAGVRGAGSGP
ncbi:MAG: AsmA family protein [Pseudomonadota bacterium]|nr:AsmA family protein [Pseudomonadota bacterium]